MSAAPGPGRLWLARVQTAGGFLVLDVRAPLAVVLPALVRALELLDRGELPPADLRVEVRPL